MIHLSQGWAGAGLGPHSRHNSYSSHTSRLTYNSHGELTGMLQSNSCRPPAFLAGKNILCVCGQTKWSSRTKSYSRTK